MTAACPSRTSIEKAKSSSAKIATYANAGVDLTRELYRANFLSLEHKDKIADGWISLANAGIAFDLAIANAEREYGDTAPKTEIQRLFNIFDSSVIEKFLVVLNSLKLGSISNNYAVIIDSIKSAILLVAGAFNQTKVVTRKLASV